MQNKKLCLTGFFLTIMFLILLLFSLHFIKKENYILGIIFIKKINNNEEKLFLKTLQKTILKNNYKKIKSIKTINLNYFFKIKKEQLFLKNNLIELKNNENLVFNNSINVIIKFKNETILFFLYKTIFLIF